MQIGDNDSGMIVPAFQIWYPASQVRQNYPRGNGVGEHFYFSESSNDSLIQKNNATPRFIEGSEANLRGEGVQKHFPHFGLSIIKTNTVHLTLRHHSYQPHQPSGHFHNDALSITCAVGGKPLLVDPGSFIYTPSEEWRNIFRSAAAHNGFFLDGHEPVPFDERLFALNIPARTYSPGDTNPMIIVSDHTLYQRLGLQAHRALELNEERATITLTDWWEYIKTNQNNPVSPRVVPTDLRGGIKNIPDTVWNFTLAPGIQAQYQDSGVLLMQEGKESARIESEGLSFELQPGWVATNYGTKVASIALRAQRVTAVNKPVRITLIYCTK